MGLLSSILLDQYKQSQAGSRAEEAKGLLGTAPQPYEIMPMGDRMSAQIGAETPGSGFLGTQQGPAAQANLLRGLLGAGYSGPDAQAMIAMAAPAAAAPTAQQRNFADYMAMDQPTQSQYERFKQAGAARTTINMGAGETGVPLTSQQKSDMGFSPQSVVVPDKQGIPRVVSKERFSQPQILSGGFASRMSQATEQVNNIMSQPSAFDPAGVQQNIDLFGMPNVLANYLKTPEGQQYRQAQTNWVSANLRKESGAAIPPEELDNERRKWFPEPGDSPEVILQKAESRKTAEAAMRKGSGGLFEEMQGEIKASAAKSANKQEPPPPPPGAVLIP